MKRKEFRDMSKHEWSVFKQAIHFLHQNRSEIYDDWTKIHLNHSRIAHGSMYFFPWHRIYILLFEQELRKISPNITLPYWDWAYDSQDPIKSPIWKEEYLGIMNGEEGDCRWKCRLKKSHCLKRNYDAESIGTFHDRLTLTQIIQDINMTFVEFSSTIEQTPHGLVHASIGGVGGDMSYMHSPNDPLFWLHHSFIDKIWYDRQTHHRNWYDLSGQTSISLSTVLPHFSKYTIQDSMNLSLLCYEYIPLSDSIIRQSSIDAFNSISNLSDRSTFNSLKNSGAIVAIQMSPLRPNASKIILPKRVPEFWIHHHHLDQKRTRLQEDKLFAITDNINRHIGHGSLSSYPWIIRQSAGTEPYIEQDPNETKPTSSTHDPNTNPTNLESSTAHIQPALYSIAIYALISLL
jgi:hypothetical protein